MGFPVETFRGFGCFSFHSKEKSLMPQTTNTTAAITAGPRLADNLALKVFSGEVLKTFNTETVMKSRVRVRTINSGTSAQFPAIGKAGAEYHTPGDLILGQQIANGEKTLTIDDLLISSVFMSNWEDAVNHFDVRSEYTNQIGQSLAQAYDQHLLAVASKAARDGTTGAVAGMGPATRVALGAAPTLDTIVSAIYDAAAFFDATNVPKNDRVVIVTPALYWDLIQDGRFLNRDFGNQNGNQSTGGLMKAAGFEIVPSNNFALNFTTGTIQGKLGGVVHSKYNVNNSTAAALVMQKQALGSLHLMDVSSEKEYQIARQGTLVVSKMAVGHGVLMPGCIRLLDAAV